MPNKYNILEDELDKIRVRDKTCVYCYKKMELPVHGIFRGDWATIKHLNHLPPWNDSKTVAICCGSCNSSRRDKPLLKWFLSLYCKENNINIKIVQKPVKNYIIFM
ncbi:MAG: hypothetical protein L3J07_02240 [Candidatus Magasanikbacteria bacterium]|nr:hypothetical protein [Candidatus Magasanikbacteria bacterium]